MDTVEIPENPAITHIDYTAYIHWLFVIFHITFFNTIIK